jgi:ribosome-binding factor A
MTTRRIARARDLVKQEVGRLLLYKVKDPALSDLTVTAVEMTGDLKRATIYYTLMTDQSDRAAVEAGLNRAKGFLRRELGQVLDLKFVPELIFEYDHELAHARHMDQVLKNLNRPTGDEGDGNA